MTSTDFRPGTVSIMVSVSNLTCQISHCPHSWFRQREAQCCLCPVEITQNDAVTPLLFLCLCEYPWQRMIGTEEE